MTDDDTAVMPPHMAHHLNLMAGADIGGTDELRGELLRLWEDPDGFENPDSDALLDSFEENNLLYVLHLGVLFGIEYERAYPTGRNGEWPVPLEDRDQ